MQTLEKTLKQNKRIRVIGIDDAPFSHHHTSRKAEVNIAGVVCANTRFEGILWGSVTQDGDDATEKLISLGPVDLSYLPLLKRKKFLSRREECDLVSLNE